MKLAIMTRGRVGKQTTLKSIPLQWLQRTVLVVPPGEKHDVPCSVVEVPPSVTNYSQKFQWILDGMGGLADSKTIILDDDLVFSKKDEQGRIITIPPHNSMVLGSMFDQMEALLSEYPLVGIHPRQMGQAAKPPYVENGRIICVQGINHEMVRGIKVDQFPILADVVLNCTLLARGKSNAIITTFFQDHGPCQAPGGCSVYRTPEMQRAAVEYLAARFPGFVKVVYRVNKQSNWLGSEGRYDYTCQWKRLHAAGVTHVLDPGTVPHPDAEERGKAGTLVSGPSVPDNVLLQRET